MKVRSFQKVVFSVIVASILSSGCSTSRSREKEIVSVVSTFSSTNLSAPEYAYSELIKNGVDPAFAKKLEAQYLKEKKNTANRDQIVQLNVLGFLSPGDYSKHFSASAVKNIRKFLKKYKNTLTKAEKEFNVPKEVIASLLWVETKHGKVMGQFHLPMVYFSLMQATHPEVAKATLTELNTRKPASNSAASRMTYTELQQKVLQRLTSKSQWAVEQIKTLEHLSNKSSLLNIRSSFAGAFGCSQFIPSSYQKFAVSASKRSPNLFDMKDCIFSVGNYLHKNGWDTQNPKSQSDALFEYNRIRDYGDVILKLAHESNT